MPRLSLSFRSASSAAVMRRRRSGTSARRPLASGIASGGPLATLPAPYMSAMKATYLLPAIVLTRSMACSLMPSQFGEISSSGRRPLVFSS
jgi:hypothetical protein